VSEMGGSRAATKSLLMDEAVRSERKDGTNTVILRLQTNRTNAGISKVHDNKVGKAQQGKSSDTRGQVNVYRKCHIF